MILKPHERLYLYSMGKRFPVTAIFQSDTDANKRMETHPNEAVIAVVGDAQRGELIFLAEKYTGEN